MDDLLVELEILFVHPDDVQQLGLSIIVLTSEVLYLLRCLLKLAPQLFVNVSQSLDLSLCISDFGFVIRLIVSKQHLLFHLLALLLLLLFELSLVFESNVLFSLLLEGKAVLDHVFLPGTCTLSQVDPLTTNDILLHLVDEVLYLLRLFV